LDPKTNQRPWKLQILINKFEPLASKLDHRQV
jgi:hypothetical protein